MKILPFIFERTGTEACADVGENKRQRVLLPRKGQRVDPQPAAAQRFMAHALRHGLFAFVPTETDAAVGVGRQPFPAETDDVVGAGHKPAARVCLQPFPEHVLRLCLKAADDVGAAAQNTEKACEKAALVRRSRQYGVDDGNHLLRPEGSVRKPRPQPAVVTGSRLFLDQMAEDVQGQRYTSVIPVRVPLDDLFLCQDAAAAQDVILRRHHELFLVAGMPLGQQCMVRRAQIPVAFHKRKILLDQL